MIKNIKIINNPASGLASNNQKLNNLSLMLLDEGYTITKYNTTKDPMDAYREAAQSCDGSYDLIIAAGGDGTVNQVISGIISVGCNIPMLIFSKGTVNDFAQYLSIDTAPHEIVKMIKENKTILCDVGKINQQYFVNVVAGGALSSVAHNTDRHLKNKIGRIAYYLEGIREFAENKLQTKSIEIESEEFSGVIDSHLFIVSNSSSIGGFNKLMPTASITDGYLDVLVFQKSPINEIMEIVFGLTSGKHVQHKNVISFKTKKVSIKNQNPNSPVEIDVDGEHGGNLPVTIEVISKKIKLLIP
jgi:diacylglycerol kinase (ATP)